MRFCCVGSISRIRWGLRIKRYCEGSERKAPANLEDLNHCTSDTYKWKRGRRGGKGGGYTQKEKVEEEESRPGNHPLVPLQTGPRDLPLPFFPSCPDCILNPFPQRLDGGAVHKTGDTLQWKKKHSASAPTISSPAPPPPPVCTAPRGY